MKLYVVYQFHTSNASMTRTSVIKVDGKKLTLDIIKDLHKHFSEFEETEVVIINIIKLEE